MTHVGDRRGACKVLVGRPRRPRLIWENHINDYYWSIKNWFVLAWTGLNRLSIGISGGRLCVH